MSEENDEPIEYTVIFGQDMPHCAEHCYEETGFDKWRCIAPDHVKHKECSEDWLHCKISAKVIENPTGNNPYCDDHQEYYREEQREKQK